MALLVGPIRDDHGVLIVNASATIVLVTGSSEPGIGPGNKIILPTSVTIGSDGNFPDVTVVPNPSVLTPQNTTYRVTLKRGTYGSVNAWNILVPDDGTYNLMDGTLVVKSPPPPDWVSLSGPPGPPGPPGPVGPSGLGFQWIGQGPPNTVIGASPGDTYLDTESGYIYQLS